MVNLDVINGAIAELEDQEITYVSAQRLASLYIIRNNVSLERSPDSVASGSEYVFTQGESEFMQAINGRKASDVYAVMDELMTLLYVTNKPLYDKVMRML